MAKSICSWASSRLCSGGRGRRGGVGTRERKQGTPRGSGQQVTWVPTWMTTWAHVTSRIIWYCCWKAAGLPMVWWMILRFAVAMNAGGMGRPDPPAKALPVGPELVAVGAARDDDQGQVL